MLSDSKALLPNKLLCQKNGLFIFFSTDFKSPCLSAHQQALKNAQYYFVSFHATNPYPLLLAYIILVHSHSFASISKYKPSISVFDLPVTNLKYIYSLSGNGWRKSSCIWC